LSGSQRALTLDVGIFEEPRQRNCWKYEQFFRFAILLLSPYPFFQTVKRNSSKEQYDLPLKIVSYEELYGWSMDEIVKAIGLKNNCIKLFATLRPCSEAKNTANAILH